MKKSHIHLKSPGTTIFPHSCHINFRTYCHIYPQSF
ncbi:unnamed protein product [Tenebrio molitor]|nr:unnamed protein product [Tenebrio molitor]